MSRWRVRFSLAALLTAVLAIGVACAALRYASELWASAAFSRALVLLLGAVLGALFRRSASRAFWVGFALFGWAYLLLVFGPWFNSSVKPRLVTTRLITYLHQKLPPAGTAAKLVSVALGRGAGVVDLDGDGLPDLYVDNGSTPNLLFTSAGNTTAAHIDVGTGLVTYEASRDGWEDVVVTNVGSPANALYRNLGNGRFVNVSNTVWGVRATPSLEDFEQVGHSLLALLFALLGGLAARWFHARRDAADPRTR
jgi:hypothetical protein